MAKSRRGIIGAIFGFGAVFVLIYALTTPIQGLVEKILTLASVGTLIVLPGFFWRPAWILPLLSLPLAVYLFTPPEPWRQSTLAEPYETSLRSYLGTKYVWGGENGRGIDCSGLIRRAWFDTLVGDGWRAKEPRLFREAAQIWWRDCTAKEMGEGYRGRIIPVSEEKSLNECDYSKLKLGDLAVTANGVHVLAYVGNKTWIQADPNLANGGDKVILTTAPSSSGWFHMRVKIRRWRMLAGSG